MAPKATRSISGFTLIELAIVLVIIGLLVGGVLVGQHLIKSAAISGTLSQIDQFNAASRTFQDKFGGFPGDLSSTRASQFGFLTRNGALGRGDGNGVLEGAAAGSPAPGGENVLFWADLSAATLVPGTYTATSCAGTGGACTPLAALDTVMPKARLATQFTFMRPRRTAKITFGC